MVTNTTVTNYWDWQVTIVFYSALHLIDAHVTYKTNQHYRSHDAVRQAINPYTYSPAALDEDCYSAYESLFKLSRRSRYLINEKHKPDSAHFTFEKHLARAIRHLYKIMATMKTKYELSYPKTRIKYPGLNQDELKIIKVFRDFWKKIKKYHILTFLKNPNQQNKFSLNLN
ncbi:MAG: hypothetical protein ACLFNJ_05645 [Bacteroidales bacterium]